MKQGQPPQTPFRRADYQAPAYLVDELELDIIIDPQRTLVNSSFEVYRNPDNTEANDELTLDGAALDLQSVMINGRQLDKHDYSINDENLVISGIGDRARLEISVAIQPASNTALEGLYVSGDFLLTQCEPQGFRAITYFLDRPDVMCRYKVTIEADQQQYPVLLSNGNEVARESLADGRHKVSWDDPFPKPTYLFALVAGDLATVDEYFTTVGGRKVLLRFVVEYGSEQQCRYAIQSLQRAMRWDEQRFGLEYDLDIYHVVVTHDFNMGAMENKSLNIFNSRYVLADQATATDADFQSIEGVIGHEYFHNWTGNRVTCRDWFQLTLKEGLTVFRDQEFSSDMQSRSVARINNVRGLRQRQFAEDAGPMAHPIRPDEYLEINNFYTATVYEKGAEIIRMYQTLLGRDGFRQGLDLYFQRHDGQAVTCDDFLAAMSDANQMELNQFGRWYSQIGTPEVDVEMHYDAAQQQCVLHMRQRQNDAAGEPLLIPVAVGLLGQDGNDLPLYGDDVAVAGDSTAILQLKRSEQQFVFTNVPEQPLPSLLRGFSAPVKLHFSNSRNDLARQMAHDSDSFNRWDSAERLQLGILKEMVSKAAVRQATNVDQIFIQAAGRLLADQQIDPALAALAMTPVTEGYLAQQLSVVDVEAVFTATKNFARGVAAQPELNSLMAEKMQQAAAKTQTWSLDTSAIGLRKLHNVLLGYLMQCQGEEITDYCQQRYFSADNMTDRLAVLQLLVNTESADQQAVLADFAERYQNNPLVMDKWFTTQAMRHHLPVTELQRLMQHSAFSIKNPNKVRAVIGAFAHANPTGFHAADGSGYEFMANQIVELNNLNPQIAARLAGCFNRWRNYTEDRQQLMKAQLENIAGAGKLSSDVFEVVTNALNKA